MKDSRNCTWRLGLNALAIAVTAGLAGFGCSGDTQTCGEGTQLMQQPDGSTTCVAVNPPPPNCQPTEMLVQDALGEQACIPRVADCSNTVCTDIPPAWANSVATLSAVLLGTNPDGSGSCACMPATCQPGYLIEGGNCIAQLDCSTFGPGYVQSGPNLCLPCDDCTCDQAPDSPACIPVACEEYPGLKARQEDPNDDLYNRALCLDAPRPPAESCVTGCHNGIEDPHPWFGGPDLTCTGCHGGTPDATSRETAHVAIPTEWQQGSTQWGRPNLRYYWNYNTLWGVENFIGGEEWLRFRNPSDLRIAEQSCGKSAGCHQDRVENVRRSVMATEVGLTGVALARAGVARSIMRGPGGIYKWDTTDGMTLGAGEMDAVVYNGDFVGSVRQITEFKIVNRENNGNYNQTEILEEAYDKQCGDCHLGNAGANNRYADFRSSGCASCHMPYALDGRSRSADQMIKKDEPTYPAAWAQIANFNANDLINANGAWLGPERSHPTYHRLSKQMSSQKCGTCHVGSNRTDWQFRGYRFDPNRDAVLALDNARLNAGQIQFTDEIDNDADANARYHGAAQNQILKYEDWNNDGIDDSPADVHFLAGMECMDCHTSAEMHNELKYVRTEQVSDWEDPSQVIDMSGALWSHQDQSTEIECISCHGNLEYRAPEYQADNRQVVKNLIVCPEPGEAMPSGFIANEECGRLGAGRWTRSKFTGRYHYTPQTVDTVADIGVGTGGGALRPNGQKVYTLNASIFHGRFDPGNPLSAANGIGPCFGGTENNCFRDNINNQNQVRQGFSHVGEPAQSAVDQMAGGLECYTCHGTWSNQCFGCHLTLADNDGNNIIRDFARSTGELTYGAIVQADFTYIDPLALQFGINSEGKIAHFQPETKMQVRHVDYENADFFGNREIVNNDANLVYNAYRHRSGYGLFQYDANARVGLPLNSDGQVYEQDARMDENAGQGFNQMMPHAIQRANPLMDCTNSGCHINLNEDNADLVLARFGANPNGFANISAYLVALDNLAIVRNNTNDAVNVDAAAGFRLDANIDPNGFVIDQQTDYVVFEDGFPLSYNNHPIKEGTYGIYTDPFYTRQYPRMAAISGPVNQAILNILLNEVRVDNLNVQLRGVR